MEPEMLRIGELAIRTGVATPTLRFYERRGLLRAPARRASGYRAYATQTVVTVRLIKRAQELGFSLEEIGELLRLREGPRACADVRRVAGAKLTVVDERIRGLVRMRDALRALLSSCDERRSRSCPILEAFEE
jgi:MerR family mercuric resistance operon transcriptional regulator